MLLPVLFAVQMGINISARWLGAGLGCTRCRSADILAFEHVPPEPGVAVLQYYC